MDGFETWMNGLETWMKRNKKLCVLTGIFGLLVSPFLWPFFLAILFQSLSLTVPIILAWLLIRQPWETKEGSHEKNDQSKNREHAHTDTPRPNNTDAGDLSESGAQTGAEQVKEGEETNGTKSEEGRDAVLWYQTEGRIKFGKLKTDLEQKGIRCFSISREGICSVRMGNAYRRVAILRGYPGNQIAALKEEAKKDGFYMKPGGKYVWVSWKIGGTGYAL